MRSFKPKTAARSQIFRFFTAILFLTNSAFAEAKQTRKIARESSAGIQKTAAVPAKGKVLGKKRVDALTVQPEVLATQVQTQAIMNQLPYTGVGAMPAQPVPVQNILPGPNMSPVALAPAVAPMLAMMFLSMLMNQSGSSQTPAAPPISTPSYIPSSPTIDSVPVTDTTQDTTADTTVTPTAPSTDVAVDDAVGSEPIPETVQEPKAPETAKVTANETVIPKNVLPPKADVAVEVKTETKPEPPKNDPIKQAEAVAKTPSAVNPNQCFNYSGAGNGLGKSAGALSIGSGACNGEVIAMDYIITNSHCMEGHRGKVRAGFGLGSGESKRAFECQGIAARNPRNQLDYAIIKCPGIGKYFPPVDIANRRPVIGETLQMATHNFSESGGIQKRVNSGKVVRPFTGEDLGDSMMSSVYGEPGNSGSGMYDKDGKWIGLLWGGLKDEGGKPSFFTPADKIVADLNKRYPAVAQQIRADAKSVADCRGTKIESATTLAKSGIR